MASVLPSGANTFRIVSSWGFGVSALHSGDLGLFNAAQGFKLALADALFLPCFNQLRDERNAHIAFAISSGVKCPCQILHPIQGNRPSYNSCFSLSFL